MGIRLKIVETNYWEGVRYSHRPPTNEMHYVVDEVTPPSSRQFKVRIHQPNGASEVWTAFKGTHRSIVGRTLDVYIVSDGPRDRPPVGSELEIEP